MKAALRALIAVILAGAALAAARAGEEADAGPGLYVRVEARDAPVHLSSLRVVVNDKWLTSRWISVREQHLVRNRQQDERYLLRAGNSSYSGENNARIIRPGGQVTYRIPTDSQPNAANVLARAWSRGRHPRVSLSRGSKPDDSGTFKLGGGFTGSPGETRRLNAMVDFASGRLAFDGETWPGSYVAHRWGLGEMFWYGFVRVVKRGCTVDFWKKNSTDFRVQGKLAKDADRGVFGARVDWHRPLERGYIYTFTLKCDSPPDYVLAGDRVVWRRERDYHDRQGHVIFTYAPEQDGPISLYFLRRAGRESETLDLDSGYKNGLYSTRRKLKGQPPDYERADAEFTTMRNPGITCRLVPRYSQEPVGASEVPVVEPDYPTADFDVVARQLIHYGYPDFYRYLDTYGIQYGVHGGRTPSGGRLNRLPTLKGAGLRHITLFPVRPRNGELVNRNPHWSAEEMTDEELIDRTAREAKKWLDLVNGGRVFFQFQEIESLLGGWGKHVRRSPSLRHLGHTNLNEKTVQEVWRLQFRALRDFMDTLRSRAGGGERVKTLALNDRAALHGAYAYHSGADVLVKKQIHRQNVNVLVSNARGNARAYGKEFGLDCDSWDRCTWYSYHPDELTQVMRVYFHSGARYMLDEMSTVANDRGAGDRLEGEGITPIGRAWLRFTRYAHTHPKRGRQSVNIGIMRGLGDMWHTVAGPSSSWESTHYKKRVNGQNYLTDFNLLDVLFAAYGRYWRCSTDRLCTGAPYGPVDMLPWDAPAPELKRYRVIALLGVNAATERQLRRIDNFVRSGGVFLCAAGHLENEAGEFVRGNLKDLFGVQITGRKTLQQDGRERPYVGLSPVSGGAGVVERLPNGDPLLVRNRRGEGASYLFSGEHVSEFGGELPRRVLRRECRRVRRVAFSPAYDRLEYMVQRRDGLCILPVFNHGNVGFPSGKTRKGPWQGTVRLHLDRCAGLDGELAAYAVDYGTPDGHARYALRRLKASRQDGILSMEVRVNDFRELVIGPAGSVQERYFNAR